VLCAFVCIHLYQCILSNRIAENDFRRVLLRFLARNKKACERNGKKSKLELKHGGNSISSLFTVKATKPAPLAKNYSKFCSKNALYSIRLQWLKINQNK